MNPTSSTKIPTRGSKTSMDITDAKLLDAKERRKSTSNIDLAIILGQVVNNELSTEQEKLARERGGYDTFRSSWDRLVTYYLHHGRIKSERCVRGTRPLLTKFQKKLAKKNAEQFTVQVGGFKFKQFLQWIEPFLQRTLQERNQLQVQVPLVNIYDYGNKASWRKLYVTLFPKVVQQGDKALCSRSLLRTISFL